MRWNPFRQWETRRYVRRYLTTRCREVTREELDITIAQVKSFKGCRGTPCGKCPSRILDDACHIFRDSDCLKVLPSELARLYKSAKTDEQKYGSMPI